MHDVYSLLSRYAVGRKLSDVMAGGGAKIVSNPLAERLHSTMIGNTAPFTQGAGHGAPICARDLATDNETW